MKVNRLRSFLSWKDGSSRDLMLVRKNVKEGKGADTTGGAPLDEEVLEEVVGTIEILNPR